MLGTTVGPGWSTGGLEARQILTARSLRRKLLGSIRSLKRSASSFSSSYVLGDLGPRPLQLPKQ